MNVLNAFTEISQTYLVQGAVLGAELERVLVSGRPRWHRGWLRGSCFELTAEHPESKIQVYKIRNIRWRNFFQQRRFTESFPSVSLSLSAMEILTQRCPWLRCATFNSPHHARGTVLPGGWGGGVGKVGFFQCWDKHKRIHEDLLVIDSLRQSWDWVGRIRREAYC